MHRAAACLTAILVGIAQPGRPARACYGGEAPIPCDAVDGESAARWMLRRAAAAVEADKARALRQFARGEAGFRTADTYVFCVGPDAIMTAHPSAGLQGQDVRDMQDEAGNRFIATMLSTAKPGGQRTAQVRVGLDGWMPSEPRADWPAFPEAVRGGDGVQDVPFARTPSRIPVPAS